MTAPEYRKFMDEQITRVEKSVMDLIDFNGCYNHWESVLETVWIKAFEEGVKSVTT